MKKLFLSLLFSGIVSLVHAQTPVLLKQNFDGRGLFSFDGKAYCSEQLNVIGDRKPWVSDGTPAGTILLSNDIRNVGIFRKGGNFVYFDGTDSMANDLEMYVTDGTIAGTNLLKDINPAGYSNPYPGVEYNGKFYFNATDGTGQGLYSSDGSAAGTIVVNAVPNVFSTFIRGYQVTNNKLLYLSNAPNGAPGSNLHSYDGVNDVILNLIPIIADNNYVDAVNGPIYPHKLNIGGDVFFGYSTGNGGQVNLMRTNGTTATQLGFSLNAAGFTNTSNAVYFRDFKVATGVELYKADLNLGNITLIADNNPSNGAAGTIQHMTVFKDTLYYFYNDGVHGFELWKSDGTASGTTMVKDILPGSSSSMSGYFANAPAMIEFCDKLYFNATDSIHGQELWETDGTTAGTKMVADLAAGTTSSDITELMVSNGRMYFFAFDSVMNFWMIEQCYTPTNIKTTEAVTNNLSVYPNPGSGSFAVEVHFSTGNEEIEVFSVAGKLVHKQKAAGEITMINLSEHANGIYFVRLKEGVKVLAGVKIIKE